MVRVRSLLLPCAMLACAMPVWPAAAAAQCLLCGSQDRGAAAPAEDVPLRIEISTGLEFARIAASGAGEVAVSPAGTRRVAGALVDLGGMALAGRVLLTGRPGRGVRVQLPDQIVLTDGRGGRAVVERIETDLPAAPRLDGSGRLSFSFGGRLRVSGGTGGDLRGRIPITADYE